MTKPTLAAILLCIASSSPAQVRNTIVWGTVYSIFHEEYPTDTAFYRQVDKDIAGIRDANLHDVMVFPMSQWNPDTKQLQWDRTDYLINAIEKNGLKFIPLLLKEEQCSHYFPIWKFKEIDGFWDAYSQRTNIRNSRENVDFADPRVFPFVESYFKEVVGRYGKRPGLRFYNVWNEPHYSSDADHVVDRFRDWLKLKYGSLARLRTVWGDDYTDWSQVSPFLNDNWNSSMPYIDWIMFRNELQGALLGQLKAVVHLYDTLHQVNANPVGTPWADFSPFGFYATDNWVFTQYNDINGASYYPDGWERSHGLEAYPAWLHNLALNTIRSASGDKEYILTELFTNAQNGLALNGYLDAKSIARIAWTAFSNDCKGILFWKWEPFHRGRQSLGRGLTTLDGGLAPRGEGVKEIGRVLNKYGPTLLQARLDPPTVAILMDMVGLLKTQEQAAEPSTTTFMYESNAGLFTALYEANITADLLRMDRPLSLEKLRQYKMVFLPFQIVMRRNIASVLKEYVRRGGHLVADSRVASIDELDFAYTTSPGAGLDTLFGTTRKDWIGKRGNFPVTVKLSSHLIPQTFEGRYFKDLLLVHGGARIIGTFSDDGKPAVVVNEFGKGWTILSAVPLGASYFRNPGNGVNNVIITIAHEAGVWPEATFTSPSGSSPDLKVHSAADVRIVYAINNDTTDAYGTLDISTNGFNAGSVTNILTDEPFQFTQRNGHVRSSITIPANGTTVVLLKQ